LVSAVMQTGGLLKDLTVAETVLYTASLFSRSKPVGEVLSRAGITQIADRRVGRCFVRATLAGASEAERHSRCGYRGGLRRTSVDST
jgi:hypothetical protein